MMTDRIRLVLSSHEPEYVYAAESFAYDKEWIKAVQQTGQSLELTVGIKHPDYVEIDDIFTRLTAGLR